MVDLPESARIVPDPEKNAMGTFGRRHDGHGEATSPRPKVDAASWLAQSGLKWMLQVVGWLNHY
uniref:Uncharacterized protein n=1 Tax=Pristionchus pacificus TaxID=54126 RepID=A0A2A6BLR5_PRIPA|eukprot:PDM66872.1 hypothetical protein PRIPAC_48289 [Pristionchus pacificus]